MFFFNSRNFLQDAVSAHAVDVKKRRSVAMLKVQDKFWPPHSTFMRYITKCCVFFLLQMTSSAGLPLRSDWLPLGICLRGIKRWMRPIVKIVMQFFVNQCLVLYCCMKGHFYAQLAENRESSVLSGWTSLRLVWCTCGSIVISKQSP